MRQVLVFVLLLSLVTALGDWSASVLTWVLAWVVLASAILFALLRIESHRRRS